MKGGLVPVNPSANSVGENVAKVGERIDAASAAAFNDRVEDGAALAGLGLGKEQPVLFVMRSSA
jgi:hypothetical protein